MPPLYPDLHFQCPLCPRTFSRRTNLSTHVRTHDKSHPCRFPCPYCEHRTDRRNDLESHIVSCHQVTRTQEERLPWESTILPAFGWDAPWSLPTFDNDAFTVITPAAPPTTPPTTLHVVMDQELHPRTEGDVTATD